MSQSNIQNKNIELATSPSEAAEVTLQAGVARISTDIYGSKTEFRAVVLTPPIPLSATEVRLFYGDEKLPANEKLQADLATKKRFMFRARILDGEVPSPHSPIPDPCALFDSTMPKAVNNLICMHTMFYSGEYSGDAIPSVGDTVKVLLEPGGQKYNLQYGHFVEIDDTVQRRRYLATGKAQKEQCADMSAMFGNVGVLGGNPSKKDPVEFSPEDPEPYLWKAMNPERSFEQIGSIYYGGTRDPSTVKFIVLHTTEGGWQSTKTVFTAGDRTASAHYVLKENGDIVQMVPENKIAYHAAHGQWNAQSIGIEIIGYAKTTKDEWLSKGGTGLGQKSAWYDSLVYLLTDICARYNITPSDRGLPGISTALDASKETDSSGNKNYLYIQDHHIAFHMHSPGNGCGGRNALLAAQGKAVPADKARCHWDPGPGFIEALANDMHALLGGPSTVPSVDSTSLIYRARNNMKPGTGGGSPAFAQKWFGATGTKYNKPTSKIEQIPQGPRGTTT